MLIKVALSLYIEVKDDEQAEMACHTLNSLDRVLSNQVEFPEGDTVDTEVQGYDRVSDEEAEERGLVE